MFTIGKIKFENKFQLFRTIAWQVNESMVLQSLQIIICHWGMFLAHGAKRCQCTLSFLSVASALFSLYTTWLCVCCQSQEPNMWHFTLLTQGAHVDLHYHGWAWLLWAGLWFLRCRWGCSIGWASGWRWSRRGVRRARHVRAPWTRPTEAHEQKHLDDASWTE